MSTFTDFAGFNRIIGTRTRYYPSQDLVWERDFMGSGSFITVPKGFKFESSVPRFLEWLLDPHDKRYLGAAALHDFMLKAGYRKLAAATVWNAAIRAKGVGYWVALAQTLLVILWTMRRETSL